jgi:hypothetical protein
MTFGPANPFKRNALQISEEMRDVQEEIGKLQYKLIRLQQELNSSHSKEYGTYTSSGKSDTYITFDNEIRPSSSEVAIRGKDWFFGVDLAKEEI